VRVLAISERASFHLHGIVEEISETESRKMKILMALVDEEGDVTYYEAKIWEPRGRFKEGKCQEIEATLLGDRVIVTGDGAAELHGAGFYGKLVGTTLHLSLIESAYLIEQDQMKLTNASTGRRISYRGLVDRAKKLQPEFETRLGAYRDLKSRGMVVKTGFKYGTHFRVYEKDPDKSHARYLIHALPSKYQAGWPEISRAVRLAHGVRKELLFSRSKKGKRKAQYIQLRRVRP
jgi:tRNA-intron endonuclease